LAQCSTLSCSQGALSLAPVQTNRSCPALNQSAPLCMWAGACISGPASPVTPMSLSLRRCSSRAFTHRRSREPRQHCHGRPLSRIKTLSARASCLPFQRSAHSRIDELPASRDSCSQRLAPESPSGPSARATTDQGMKRYQKRRPVARSCNNCNRITSNSPWSQISPPRTLLGGNTPPLSGIWP